MSHRDTSGTFLFPIDKWNILPRGCASFLIDDGAMSSKKFDGISGRNPRI